MTSPYTWLITFIVVDEQGVLVVLKDAMSQILLPV
jgi:hypothetical protein